MAAKTKYATIEEAATACGIELTEQSRPFLQAFVKKAEGEVSAATASNKKKELVSDAQMFGVTGVTAEDNPSVLLIKILTFLYEEGRTVEMHEFAAKHHVHVTEEGHIHRVRAAVKPVEERNAGVKEGTVGYNTIQLLKDPAYASLTAAELAEKLAEVYEQRTTAPSVQWYINYCLKKHKLAVDAGDEDAMARYEIATRRRSTAGKSAGTGLVLGAELTMEKATAPRGFAKKGSADLGANIE